MSVEKIYENNSFLFECEVTVISCEKEGEQYKVQLDRTPFFPTGGGQPCDLGTIGDATVIDVAESGEEVIHTTDAPLKAGKTYTAVVDSERRWDFMQQHIGEHILSYAFWKLFEFNNVGFHLNEDFATLDLDGIPTAEQMREAEEFANKIVTDDAPIKVYYCTREELNQKPFRKASEKSGDHPRIVEVVGSDICTCCGTPLASSGQVGMIKIYKTEKLRGGLRIYFYCGKRAYVDLTAKSDLIKELCDSFSCDMGRLTDGIKGLRDEISSLKADLKAKADLLMGMKASELIKSGENPVVTCQDNTTPKEAKTLLNMLIEKENITAVVVYNDGNRIGYLAGCGKASKGDCKNICELLNCVLNGKGGGNKTFAQGGANIVPDWQERVESIINNVKNFA